MKGRHLFAVLEHLAGLETDDAETERLLEEGTLMNDLLSDADAGNRIPLKTLISAISQNNYTPYVAGASGLPVAVAESKLRNVLEQLMRKDPIQQNLWLSVGGTQVTLHNNPSENWYCQLAGTKTFRLYAPEDVSKLYPITFSQSFARQQRIFPRNFDYKAEYVYVFRDSGHLEAFPTPPSNQDTRLDAAVDRGNLDDPDLARLPKFKGVQETLCKTPAGTCLWVPMSWWHNVRADAGFNVALNLWFGSNATARTPRWDSEEDVERTLKALHDSMTHLTQQHRRQQRKAKPKEKGEL